MWSLGLVLVRSPQKVPVATVWKTQCEVGVLTAGCSQPPRPEMQSSSWG